MKRIRQAQKVHFFGGTLRLTGAYDTNARVSPVDDVTVGGLTATIPVERDTYLSQALSLRHEYRLPHTRHTWATQFVNSNSLYSSQTDLELNYFSLETGPRLDFESWALGLRGTARHVSKDYSDYLRSFGGAATLTAPVTERVWLSVDVAGEDRKYYGNRENTGTNVLCAAGPTMAWGRNTLGLSVGYEVNWAARDFESYDRLICDLQYRRGFRYGISMQLGYRYARSLFDSPDIAYSFSRRKDHVHECSVMLRKSLVRSLALEVGHTYSKSTSSVGLYDYGRQVTSLSLSYDF